MPTHCNRCHTCGAQLERCLDGEEWCPKCQAYRLYKSHGWGWRGEGEWYCPKVSDAALPVEPVKRGGIMFK